MIQKLLRSPTHLFCSSWKAVSLLHPSSTSDISHLKSQSIHQDTAIKLHEEQPFVQPHFNITTAPSTCYRSSELPAELQLEVWKHAAAPEGEVGADASHPRNVHRRPHCSISAMLLVITGGSQAGRARWDASQPSRSHFKGTAENILRFTQVYMTRGSMMASCKVARFMAVEAWKREFLTLRDHNVLHGCISLGMNQRKRMLSHLEVFLKYVSTY